MNVVRDASGEKFKNYKDYSFCLTGMLDLNLSVRMQVLGEAQKLSRQGQIVGTITAGTLMLALDGPTEIRSSGNQSDPMWMQNQCLTPPNAEGKKMPSWRSVVE